MRKLIVDQQSAHAVHADQRWLDLQSLAHAELTSEDAAYPIEGALTASAGPGWRAAQAGTQTIRLRFDDRQRVSRIQLLFHEDERARVQEFALLWSPDNGQSYKEIVRQQYTFSPPGMTREFEDYGVELSGVTALELRIIPDISGGDSRASVAQLRIA